MSSFYISLVSLTKTVFQLEENSEHVKVFQKEKLYLLSKIVK